MAAFKVQLAPSPALQGMEGEAWRSLIEKHCGLYFSEARTHQMERALQRRMQAEGVAGFGQYYRQMAAAPPGEWTALLEALTNHETSFFRHAPTFRVLEKELLPNLAKSSARAEASLWSAGCSTGEEAYSAAMVWQQVRGRYPWLRCSILASDISDEALETAAKARYGDRAVQDLPSQFRSYLSGRNEVAVEVKEAVRFSKVNLVDAATYPQETFDIILCQNVFVYFRQDVGQLVLRGLISRLRPGGCLLPGPGEIAGLDVDGLRCVLHSDVQVFRKQP